MASSPSTAAKCSAWFPSTRFPEADPGPERALRSRLQDVLVGDRAPQEYDALLLGLLEPLGLVEPLVERPQRREARNRAQEIVDQVIAGTLTTLLSGAVLSIFAAVQNTVSAGGGDGDGGGYNGGGGWWA